MTLDSPVAQLPRVGAVLNTRLAMLGIRTVRDLLMYFPFRYEDYSAVTPIRGLPLGGDQVTIRGRVELIANKRSPRTRKIITEAVVNDGTDQLRVVWFGQPFLTKTLQVGDEVYLSGKLKNDRFGVSLVSPTYEKYHPSKAVTHTARIVPMYPLTSGVTQKIIRSLVAEVLPLAKTIPDWLPETILRDAGVVPFARALSAIHFPETLQEQALAIKRLKFDEVFVLQLRAEMVRQSLRRVTAPVLTFQEQAIRSFVETLPFALTKDQKIAAWEIFQDLGRAEPMNRLLEGDVGSGKTVVAAMALYLATLHGYQGVLMAPTEILATQHVETLKRMYEKTNISVALLTRTQCEFVGPGQGELENVSPIKKKALVREHVARGKAQIIVGTHALLGEAIQFFRLGLTIVDEQHRFGVEQRKTMHEKSGTTLMPHFLSMTATPIPRSLALTLYGDLDLSRITQMPPGRKPIITRLVDPHEREQSYDFIRRQIAEGRQVFVLCPLIEESMETGERFEADEKKTVMKEFKRLSEQVFPDLRVGYLHGKMAGKDKDAAMASFARHELDILVATSVIEVGVNIPNASVMLIEGAESFGLAQLHQLRGRVGRSTHQSYCLLFSNSMSGRASERLAYFASTTDGFLLAEYDLHERGPGEVYGTAQSGLMQLKLATLRDTDIIATARALARDIDLSLYPTLRARVKEWEETVHLE